MIITNQSRKRRTMDKKACIFNIQRFSIHDGPGIRTTIFFKGCPLKCYWCSNPESWSGQPEPIWDNLEKKEVIVGEFKTIKELVSEILKDIDFYKESGGGVTLSGGEVLFQVDFAIQLLKALQKENIHTACETSGYGNRHRFITLIKYTDLLLFDLKHYEDKCHRNGTGLSNKIILENLAIATKLHSNLVVRIPIIPSYNDSKSDAIAFAKLLHTKGVRTVELLPFHQFGENKYKYLNKEYCMKGIPQLREKDLENFKDVLLAQGLNCNIQ